MLRKFFNRGCINQFVTNIAALGLPSLVLLAATCLQQRFAIAITSGDTPVKTALTFLGGFTGIRVSYARCHRMHVQ